jgi:hypothetical protein
LITFYDLPTIGRLPNALSEVATSTAKNSAE